MRSHFHNALSSADHCTELGIVLNAHPNEVDTIDDLGDRPRQIGQSQIGQTVKRAIASRSYRIRPPQNGDLTSRSTRRAPSDPEPYEPDSPWGATDVTGCRSHDDTHVRRTGGIIARSPTLNSATTAERTPFLYRTDSRTE